MDEKPNKDPAACCAVAADGRLGMKITDIQAKIFSLPLKQPVKIALGEITQSDTVIVRVETDTGLCGFGEGSGIPFVTGETCGDVLLAIALLREPLLGLDPWAIGEAHRRMDAALTHRTAAKAAIDLALYDLMGKAARLPLYRLLGGVQNTVETDKTIALAAPDVMAEEARELAQAGFHYIKIKAGLDPAEDLEAVRRIRDAVGSGVHLKLDANQGWSVSQAIRTIRAMEPYGLEAVEQPIAAWDIAGLAAVRAKTVTPIMADESCFSARDALALVQRQAVDFLNIKLMKSCGLYDALRINAIAEAAGVSCMLGCMMESRLGIAAGAALIAACQNFRYADLDSTMFTQDHPDIRGGYQADGPILRLGDAYGVGVEVDF